MRWDNFTAERVAQFACKPGKQQSIYWDGKTPGLGLRVTATGAKSYIFEASLYGCTIRLTIGDVRTWKIGKAQAEATRLKACTDQGIDPRQQKAEQRTKARAAQVEMLRRNMSLADVWPVYLQAHKARWSAGHYANHINLAAPGGQPKKRGKGLTVAGPLAPLMALPLSTLTGATIAAWLEKEAAKRPTNAAQSFRILRAFVRWAAETPAYQDLIPADAYSTRAIKEALPQSQSKEGDSLQREQLAKWFASVRSLKNPVISAYLQALLLTGARREEMARLRWQDVDFQWRSLTIHDKVEGIRVIPLPLYLSIQLAALPRHNEWVFSSLSAANGRLTEPRIAHTKALKAAGLPHVSLHGLRRSFGTLCEWVEMPTGISAQIMGHKPSALAEKHYRRRPLDLLRKWHDHIEGWILDQADVKFVAIDNTPCLVRATAG